MAENKIIVITTTCGDEKSTERVLVDYCSNRTMAESIMAHCSEVFAFAELQKKRIGQKTKKVPLFDYWVNDKRKTANVALLHQLCGVLNSYIIPIDATTPDEFFKVEYEYNTEHTVRTFCIQKCKYLLEEKDGVKMEFISAPDGKKGNKTEKTPEEKFIAYVNKSGLSKKKILELLEKCEFSVTE